MELPVVPYIDMVTTATGWLAVAVGGVFATVLSLIAAMAALRVFSRFLSYGRY